MVLVLFLRFVDPEVDAVTVLFWRALFPLWKQDYESA